MKSENRKLWIVQFVNTAVIIVLINADYTGVREIHSSMPILRGKYSDFSAEWYRIVGASIVISIFINAITSLRVLQEYLKAGFFRCKDRQWTSNPRVTQQ